MDGVVNTTMKDKHLNLEDAASHPSHNKAAQLMVLEPPPPPHPSVGSDIASRRSRGGVEAGLQ